MSDSVRPHKWQPTKLLCHWDSPGKNIGMGCHFLLQCMKKKSESEVTQSCPTLSDPMDCSLPGSSIHGIFRQKYWSGLPLPSPEYSFRLSYLGYKKKIFKIGYLSVSLTRLQILLRRGVEKFILLKCVSLSLLA